MATESRPLVQRLCRGDIVIAISEDPDNRGRGPLLLRNRARQETRPVTEKAAADDVMV